MALAVGVCATDRTCVVGVAWLCRVCRGVRAFKRALLRAKAKNPDRWRKRPDLRKLPISEMAPTAPPEIDSPFTGGDLTPRVLGANDLSTTTSKQLREMRLNSSKHDIVIGSTSHLCCFRRAAGPTSDTCACAFSCVAVWLCGCVFLHALLVSTSLTMT